jgi:hypothetical protein
MIMQIAGFNQFPDPVVEPVDPGTSFFGSALPPEFWIIRN